MRLKSLLGRPIRNLIRPLGYDIARYVSPEEASRLEQAAIAAKAAAGPVLPIDFSPEDAELFKAVSAYTVTSPERVFTLARALEYIVQHRIPGDIVECGVWQGGSMMAAALTLKRIGDTSRNIYLCDVFHTGWPKPTDEDVTIAGENAVESWEYDKSQGREFATPNLDTIKANMHSTGYPADKLHFIVGKVQDTLPAQGPQTIALVRLDTDLYESTLHEITHMYPRVSSGGILIIDDYGTWKGSRKAVDEYLAAHQPRVFVQRIDFTGRLIVKP